MKKTSLSVAVLLLILVLAGCTSTDYSTNKIGWSDYTTVAVKDFTSLGFVTVTATEIRSVGPLGFLVTHEGTKVTYADLIREAVKLGADDIINVRIDSNHNYKTSPLDYFTGWTRTYTYTGTALAIKYTEKVDTSGADPHLAELDTSSTAKKGLFGNIIYE